MGERTIIFRGKRKDNGEWVEGYYVLIATTRHYIFTGKFDILGGGVAFERYEVIPETISEFTGLCDKNGKKIFEGDIVVVYARGYHTVCTVSWAETVAHFQLWQINTIPKTSTNLSLGNYDCEVVGNIHDNPELLKGGAEKCLI